MMDNTQESVKSLTARPYRFNARTVISIPKEIVEKYSIEEGLSELVITPGHNGFSVQVRRRGDFTT